VASRTASMDEVEMQLTAGSANEFSWHQSNRCFRSCRGISSANGKRAPVAAAGGSWPAAGTSPCTIHPSRSPILAVYGHGDTISLRRGCGQSGLAGWRAVAVPVCWPRRRADMDANCERVSASEGRVSALMCRRRRRQVVFWVGEDGREELRGPRCRVGAFSIGCRAIAAIRLELLLCGRAQSRERSRARRPTSCSI